MLLSSREWEYSILSCDLMFVVRSGIRMNVQHEEMIEEEEVVQQEGEVAQPGGSPGRDEDHPRDGPDNGGPATGDEQIEEEIPSPEAFRGTPQRSGGGVAVGTQPLFSAVPTLQPTPPITRAQSREAAESPRLEGEDDVPLADVRRQLEDDEDNAPGDGGVPPHPTRKSQQQGQNAQPDTDGETDHLPAMCEARVVLTDMADEVNLIERLTRNRSGSTRGAKGKPPADPPAAPRKQHDSGDSASSSTTGQRGRGRQRKTSNSKVAPPAAKPPPEEKKKNPTAPVAPKGKASAKATARKPAAQELGGDGACTPGTSAAPRRNSVTPALAELFTTPVSAKATRPAAEPVPASTAEAAAPVAAPANRTKPLVTRETLDVADDIQSQPTVSGLATRRPVTEQQRQQRDREVNYLKNRGLLTMAGDPHTEEEQVSEDNPDDALYTQEDAFGSEAQSDMAIDDASRMLRERAQRVSSSRIRTTASGDRKTRRVSLVRQEEVYRWPNDPSRALPDLGDVIGPGYRPIPAHARLWHRFERHVAESARWDAGLPLAGQIPVLYPGGEHQTDFEHFAFVAGYIRICCLHGLHQWAPIDFDQVAANCSVVIVNHNQHTWRWEQFFLKRSTITERQRRRVEARCALHLCPDRYTTADEYEFHEFGTGYEREDSPPQETRLPALKQNAIQRRQPRTSGDLCTGCSGGHTVYPNWHLPPADTVNQQQPAYRRTSEQCRSDKGKERSESVQRCCPREARPIASEVTSESTCAREQPLQATREERTDSGSKVTDDQQEIARLREMALREVRELASKQEGELHQRIMEMEETRIRASMDERQANMMTQERLMEEMRQLREQVRTIGREVQERVAHLAQTRTNENGADGQTRERDRQSERESNPRQQSSSIVDLRSMTTQEICSFTNRLRDGCVWPNAGNGESAVQAAPERQPRPASTSPSSEREVAASFSDAASVQLNANPDISASSSVLGSGTLGAGVSSIRPAQESRFQQRTDQHQLSVIDEASREEFQDSHPPAYSQDGAGSSRLPANTSGQTSQVGVAGSQGQPRSREVITPVPPAINPLVFSTPLPRQGRQGNRGDISGDVYDIPPNQDAYARQQQQRAQQQQHEQQRAQQQDRQQRDQQQRAQQQQHQQPNQYYQDIPPVHDATLHLLEQIRQGVYRPRGPSHKLEAPRAFKGTADEDWDVQKRKFLNFKESTQMDDEQFTIWLDNKIEGEAARVLLGAKKQKRETWRGQFEILDSRFAVSRDRPAALSAFENALQEETESPSQFVDRLVRLRQKAVPEEMEAALDENVIRVAMGGFRDGRLRDKVIFQQKATLNYNVNPWSVEQFHIVIANMEEACKQLRTWDRKFGKGQAVTNTIFKRPTTHALVQQQPPLYHQQPAVYAEPLAEPDNDGNDFDIMNVCPWCDGPHDEPDCPDWRLLKLHQGYSPAEGTPAGYETDRFYAALAETRQGPCYNCGGWNHFKRDCPEPPRPRPNPNQNQNQNPGAGRFDPTRRFARLNPADKMLWQEFERFRARRQQTNPNWPPQPPRPNLNVYPRYPQQQQPTQQPQHPQQPQMQQPQHPPPQQHQPPPQQHTQQQFTGEQSLNP